MKKFNLTLLISLLAMSVFSAEFTDFVLREGFEQGMPSGWTQEYVVGHQSWEIESSSVAAYPTGAYEGNQRLVLRNNTQTSQGFTTRLISPKLELSKVFEPILIFSHAQQQRTGDFEHLKVYYRTSSNGNWILLKEYTSKIARWQEDTIELAATTDDYYVAFEATDAMGHGVVLDDIRIRTKPTCAIPSQILATTLDPHTTQLTWKGSYDTETFELIISTDSLATIDPEAPTVIKHVTTPDFSFTLTGLPTQMTYWGYIKATCDEETDWAAFKFNTPNVVDLPYTQTFDMEADQNFIFQPEGWVCGTSLLNNDGDPAFIPYINTDEMSITISHFSHSVTTALAFVGTSTYIPAGQYAYAATPELNVKSIKNVEVTFWGASYYYQKLGAANGITVGVMTDPNDFASFVPVKTVYNRGFDNPFYYHVSFENYEGDGKYIAFVSDFKDQDNLFFVDDVTITENAPLNVPTQIVANNWKPESFDINVNTHGAATWNLILANGTYSAANAPIEDGSEPQESSIVLRKTGLTGNKVTINMSELPASFNYQTTALYIYAQAVNGGSTSAWSLPAKYRIPDHVASLPYTYSFETADDPRYSKQNVTMFNLATTNNGQSVPSSVILPWASMNYGPYAGSGTVAAKTTADGAGCLMLYSNTIFALSELPTNVDAKALGIELYVKANSTTTATRTVDVGVMTDPYDISTFEKVTSFSFVNNTDMNRQYISLAGYKGNGHWLAFYPTPTASATSGTGLYSTILGRIDRITVDSVTDCVPANGLAVDSLGQNAVTLKWDAAGMHIFDVKVGTALATINNMQTLDPNSIVATKHVEDASKATITGLKPATTYYFIVESVCGNSVVTSASAKFMTDCPDQMSLPYKEDFESYAGGLSSGDLPTCWNFIKKYTSGSNTYPYIYTTASYAHSGSKSLYFSASSYGKLLAVLPQFTTKAKNLELTFWLRPTSTSYVTKDSIEVGVMTDPNDENTFEKVACFQPLTTTHMECIVDFSTAKSDGMYIAIRKAYYLNSYYIIDDVFVDELGTCRKVRDLTVGNIKHNGAIATWTSSGAAQYQVVVMTEDMDPDVALATSGKVLCNVTSNTNSANLTSADIEPYSTYYISVRGICDDGYMSKWSTVKSFTTACQPVTPATFGVDGVETFDNSSVLNCWTTGILTGTTQKPSISSKSLYLYSNASSDGSYAIMPALDVPDIKQVQISFDAHAGITFTDSHILTIGVVTNPQDMATGVGLKTLTLPCVTSVTAFDEAPRYTVRFLDYDGDFTGQFGTQPYFTTVSDGKIDKIYIDNLTVETLGTVLEPVDVVFDNVTLNEIQVSWEKGLGTSFEVKIADSKIDPATEAGLRTLTVTNDTTCTISGLNPLTTYYVYVRTVNGSQTSKWSNVRWCTTDCPASYPLPLMENFDTYNILTAAPYTQPVCWKLYYGGEELTASARISADAKLGGNGGLLLSSQQSTGKDSYAVLPTIAEGFANTCVKLSCKTLGGTVATRYLRIGIATVIEPAADMIQSITWVDSLALTNSDWQYKYFDLSSYAGTGKNIVLGFVGGDITNATSAAQIYIDDVVVMKKSACYSPFNVRITKRGKDFLSVAWDESTGTKWELAYWPAAEAFSNAKIIECTEQNATATGLMPSTTYNFAVRTVNGSNTSEWTNAIDGETYCVIPVSEAEWGFEDDSFKSCWFIGWVGSGTDPIIQSNVEGTSYLSKYSHTGENALSLNGYSGAGNNTYAIMPQLSGDLSDLQLHAYVRMTYKQEYTDPTKSTFDVEGFQHGMEKDFFVGVVDDPEDVSNIINLVTYTCPDYQQKPSPWPANEYWDDIIIPMYGLEGKYIVFYTNERSSQIYIDDITLEPVQGCPAPAMIIAKEETLTANSADIQWNSNADKWNVIVLNGKDTIFNGVVNTNPTLHLDNLSSNTSYDVKVQAVCDQNTKSDWGFGSIKTLCSKVDLMDAFWDFESNLEQTGTGNSVYTVPSCMAVGALGTQASGYMSAIATDNDSYGYSRNVSADHAGTHSLRMYAGDDRVYSSYVILPELDFNVEDKLLRFYARIGSFERTLTIFNAKGAFRTNPKSSNWPNDLVVGYTIGDDFSTFVPVDTAMIDISYNNITAFQTTESERADRFWDNINIPLQKYAGENHRICIVYNISHAMGITNTAEIHLDDISIVPNDACLAPHNLAATEITSHSAKLSWDYTSVCNFRLQVANDLLCEDLILDTNIVASTFDLTNLTQGTRYFYRIRHNCYGGEFSDWSDVMDFSTNFSVRFNNSFPNLGGGLPDFWSKGRTTTPDKVFNGERVSDPVIIAGTDEWQPYMMTDVMTVGHMYCETYNNYSSVQWLFSPNIDLSEITTEKVMLSFDLAVTSITGFETRTDDVQDEFWVLVSLNDGKTWTKENSTLWSNDDANADFKYGTIPVSNTGKKFYVDYTKYAGKNIKLAFVSVSNKTATKHYLHLGNVQVNTFKQYDYTASLCQYEDFENELVYIDAAEIPAGHQVIERFTPAIKNGVDDQLVIVTVDVEPIVPQTFAETVCQGETYDKHGFNFVANASGSFQQKLQCVGGLGCDSVISLDLTVLPSSEKDSIISICQGAFVEIGNNKYYTSGTYRDTISSLVTGCDSIINLFLTITPMLDGEGEVWLCPGMDYVLGDTTITTAGVYKHVIQNMIGCDSLVTLTVHQEENVKSRYIQTICYGDTYSDEHVSGISAAGDYQFDLKTIHDCDSTVVLHLLVASEDNVINDEVKVDELPYIVDGSELIPVDATPGDYSFMINSSCGIVTLNVTVGVKSAIEDVRSNRADNVQKIVYDNHIYIIRNGVWYDVIGNVAK